MSLSPEPPNEPAPTAEACVEAQAEELLPVPLGPLRSQPAATWQEPRRTSIWRRITMRRRGADSSEALEGGEAAARLAAIEQRLSELDSSVQTRFEALGARFEEVWQSEEQLSQLADIQDKLDRLARLQEKLSSSVVSLRWTLAWVAALVVAAALAGQIVAKQFL